jgi:hypothetical protein
MTRNLWRATNDLEIESEIDGRFDVVQSLLVLS